MTQATDSQSFFEAYVEYKSGAAPWTDISGFATALALGGGDRQTGDAYTFTGDTAIIGIGKRQPTEITLRCVYTEGGNDPWTWAYNAWRNHTIFQLRWVPKGGQTNEKRYTTDASYSFVINCPPPVGEAGSGDPMISEIVIRTRDITQDTETT